MNGNATEGHSKDNREIGNSTFSLRVACGFVLIACFHLVFGGCLAFGGEQQAVEIPTGQTITPTAAKGALFEQLDPKHAAAPDLRPGQAVAITVSSDGRTLAILTSGYNRFYSSDSKASTTPHFAPELSTEYLFLFDLSDSIPKQIQVLPVPNTFQGLVKPPPPIWQVARSQFSLK